VFTSNQYWLVIEYVDSSQLCHEKSQPGGRGGGGTGTRKRAPGCYAFSQSFRDNNCDLLVNVWSINCTFEFIYLEY